jgi:hypothetical protein
VRWRKRKRRRSRRRRLQWWRFGCAGAGNRR